MRQIVYHNGNPVQQDPVLTKDIPVGRTFGLLSNDWIGPIRSKFGESSVGLQEGEEHYYKVVLSTYVRTENGYVSPDGGPEHPLNPDWAILL